MRLLSHRRTITLVSLLGPPGLSILLLTTRPGVAQESGGVTVHAVAPSRGEPAVASDGAHTSDRWITTVAKLRLLANRKTPGLAIDVDTYEGLVILFGIVDSEVARATASAEVLEVHGVRGVLNAIQLVADGDARVVEAADHATRVAVEKRLDDHARYLESDFDVDVKKGLVRVRGGAKSPRERLLALAVASTTPGARAVLDEIHLEPAEGSGR